MNLAKLIKSVTPSYHDVRDVSLGFPEFYANLIPGNARASTGERHSQPRRRCNPVLPATLALAPLRYLRPPK